MAQFIQEHRLLLLLVFAAVCTFIWLMRFRSRLGMKWYAALCCSILHVAYGVFCVKAFAVLEGNPVSNGAMSLFGAVFFMPVAYWLGAKIFKRDTRTVFDLFTVPLVFTLACARVNCLFAGCCKGLVIPFIHSHTVRWPVRETELVFYAVLLAFFVIRTFKNKTNGELYPIYLMAYGVFRFVIEFFRESDHILGLFHISHLWAMLALIIGASVYFEIHNKKRKKRS